jgi:hypothetical protein
MLMLYVGIVSLYTNNKMHFTDRLEGCVSEKSVDVAINKYYVSTILFLAIKIYKIQNIIKLLF